MQHPATDADFDKIMSEAGATPVLLKFSATWCGPCVSISCEMEGLANEYAGNLICIHVDVDALEATSQKYGISCMPTIKISKGGEVMGEDVQGANMAGIKALVEKALA